MNHLYVCPKNSRELKRYVAFRDFLRRNPDAVKKYGKIKEKAACLYPDDIDKYMDFKSHYIDELYGRIGLK